MMLGGGSSSRRVGPIPDSAPLKAAAVECTTRCIQSATNLLHLLRDTSPSRSLAKLPKEILAKVPNVKKTGKLLHQMPAIIIVLDTNLDAALQSASCLHDVRSLFFTSDDATQLEPLINNVTMRHPLDDA
ncbi:hypothetical protein O6H91_19G034000 [Diphasiastrum complanatum]|uniref:Uncharacterized protein n=1 Tax=Diphasiastrum complanatum TaxID=34168 RepID=A0ACC2AU79_DIPCM|nr:hypothetical protein O6H91_19G034000 [Diphasiastrum complanatum]